MCCVTHHTMPTETCCCTLLPLFGSLGTKTFFPLPRVIYLHPLSIHSALQQSEHFMSRPSLCVIPLILQQTQCRACFNKTVSFVSSWSLYASFEWIWKWAWLYLLLRSASCTVPRSWKLWRSVLGCPRWKSPDGRWPPPRWETRGVWSNRTCLARCPSENINDNTVCPKLFGLLIWSQKGSKELVETSIVPSDT